MVLSKQETAVLIKLKPEWARYVRKNGEILVKVKKSIYGLKESGRLWYEEFVLYITRLSKTNRHTIGPSYFSLWIFSYIIDLILELICLFLFSTNDWS
jgi:hypothetical protein